MEKVLSDLLISLLGVRKIDVRVPDGMRYDQGCQICMTKESQWKIYYKAVFGWD